MTEPGASSNSAAFSDSASAALDSIEPTSIPESLSVVLEQQVLDAGDVVERFHVIVDGGEITVVEGQANEPDLVIRQDRETAESIRSGTGHAQTAFLTGRLTIDGDIDKLLEIGPALADLLSAISAPGHA